MLLWQNLMCLFDHYKGPCLIRGDFNEILHSSEKFGGRVINNSHSNNFIDCINYCNLVDLGYKGSKYGWTNKRKLGSNILERLNRLLANYDWVNLFPEAMVHHLPRTHLDDSPLLLNTQPSRITKSPIFRLETMWTTHSDFINILRDNWHPPPTIIDAIASFKHNISN